MSDAIIGYISSFQSLRDGTLRIKIDVQPADSKDALNTFCSVDGMVAMVGIDINKPAKVKGEYSEHAKELFKSGTFYDKAIWQAAGTDAEYLAWLRKQDCACKLPDHSGQIVAAHVRRVEYGSGTGIKPAYSAIPLCDAHHQRQHKHGESHVPVKGRSWEKARIKYAAEWSQGVIKDILGYESWTDVPPEAWAAWQQENVRGI